MTDPGVLVVPPNGSLTAAVLTSVAVGPQRFYKSVVQTGTARRADYRISATLTRASECGTGVPLR